MKLSKADIKSIQNALIKLGYDVGKAGADGIIGRDTTKAIAEFQKHVNLKVLWPGTIGPKTIQALNLNSLNSKKDGPVTPDLPWIAYARTFLGLHEKRDAAKLDKALKLDASEIAWCGAFVAMCISATLLKESLPSNPLGSRNWTKFGQKITGPQIGAVVVFWRGSPSGWQGHVGFVVGHDKTHVHVLGGNQSDSVSIARISKTRLLGYYWPNSYPPIPTQLLDMTTINATITENEA